MVKTALLTRSGPACRFGSIESTALPASICLIALRQIFHDNVLRRAVRLDSLNH